MIKYYEVDGLNCMSHNGYSVFVRVESDSLLKFVVDECCKEINARLIGVTIGELKSYCCKHAIELVKDSNGERGAYHIAGVNSDVVVTPWDFYKRYVAR